MLLSCMSPVLLKTQRKAKSELGREEGRKEINERKERKIKRRKDVREVGK